MRDSLVTAVLFLTLTFMTIHVSVEGDCKGNKSVAVSCSVCIGRGNECYFCVDKSKGQSKSNGTCLHAQWNPDFCSDFYTLTCSIEGIIWVSLVGAGAGLVLLFIIGCVIYCCCCRGKAKRRKQYESRERDDKRKRQDMKERQDARKSDRKTKNDAIRKKYGLYKDSKDEELDDAPFSSSTGTTGRYQRFDND